MMPIKINSIRKKFVRLKALRNSTCFFLFILAVNSIIFIFYHRIKYLKKLARKIERIMPLLSLYIDWKAQIGLNI